MQRRTGARSCAPTGVAFVQSQASSPPLVLCFAKVFVIQRVQVEFVPDHV
jgi:hypothetical protein